MPRVCRKTAGAGHFDGEKEDGLNLCRREGFAPAEQQTEQKLNQRPAEKDLPEKRHGKIAGNGLQPAGYKLPTRPLENDRGPEAHDGAHECHCDAGTGQNHKNWPVHRRIHQTEGDARSESVHKAEAHHNADGKDDQCFRQCGQNPRIGQLAHAQAGVIKLHGQHHEQGHQQAIHQFFQFCLWHDRKHSFLK